MNKTKIEWTDRTWNPIAGCSPISSGCLNCYAKDMAHRFHTPWGKPVFMPERLIEPLKLRKPSRIFVCSVSDLFHVDVAIDDIRAIMEVIRNCPQHTFQILTKRPARMAAYFTEKEAVPMNVWLGVSAETQELFDVRWGILAGIPRVIRACVRFVSVEPMLSPVRLNIDTPPDWVICGPENGRKKRPCDPDWITDLERDCYLAGTTFFDKRPGGAKEFPAGALTPSKTPA